MKVLDFVERHLGKIVVGSAIATVPLLSYNLYKNNQMAKYYNKNIELSGHVFGKSAYAHFKTENEVKNLSPKEQYDRWKQVNDSLDYEQAKSLLIQINDKNLNQQMTRELKGLTAQQAVSRLKQVVDSVKNGCKLNIVR